MGENCPLKHFQSCLVKSWIFLSLISECNSSSLSFQDGILLLALLLRLLPVLQKMWGIVLCSTAHSCHVVLFSFHPKKLKHKAWLHDCLLQGRKTTHGMGMGPGRELKQWQRHRLRLLVLSHPCVHPGTELPGQEQPAACPALPGLLSHTHASLLSVWPPPQHWGSWCCCTLQGKETNRQRSNETDILRLSPHLVLFFTVVY